MASLSLPHTPGQSANEKLEEYLARARVYLRRRRERIQRMGKSSLLEDVSLETLAYPEHHHHHQQHHQPEAQLEEEMNIEVQDDDGASVCSVLTDDTEALCAISFPQPRLIASRLYQDQRSKEPLDTSAIKYQSGAYERGGNRGGNTSAMYENNYNFIGHKDGISSAGSGSAARNFSSPAQMRANSATPFHTPLSSAAGLPFNSTSPPSPLQSHVGHFPPLPAPSEMPHPLQPQSHEQQAAFAHSEYVDRLSLSQQLLSIANSNILGGSSPSALFPLSKHSSLPSTTHPLSLEPAEYGRDASAFGDSLGRLQHLLQRMHDFDVTLSPGTALNNRIEVGLATGGSAAVTPATQIYPAHGTLQYPPYTCSAPVTPTRALRTTDERGAHSPLARPLNVADLTSSPFPTHLGRYTFKRNLQL